MPEKKTHNKTTAAAHAKHQTAPKQKEGRYTEAIGRRKTAVARVRIVKGGKGVSMQVNGRELAKYFPLEKLRTMALAPFHAASVKDVSVSVKVTGGGMNAQAEAIRLGAARALVENDGAARPRLKTLGFLKRDPRMVERKKPGLRKARRPQQWRKR